MSDSPSRREFVAQSASMLSGAWLFTQMPMLEALSARARVAHANAEPFEVLTPAESRTMAAFAAQIVPTDSTPGATEAGVVYFTDKALGSFAAIIATGVRSGLKQLDDEARKANRSVQSFADLTSAQQIKIMKKHEGAEFFGDLRFLTLAGVFADQSYGGNRNGVGYQIMDMKHQAAFQPPFGYYDAQLNSSTKARNE